MRLGRHHFAHLRATAQGGEAGKRKVPAIDEWAEEQGLEDWSQVELQEMYRATFAVDRKSGRNQRLLERQLALLFELEKVAAETPKPGSLCFRCQK